MSFQSRLIHTCDVKSKTLVQVGYEKTPTWQIKAEDVACRYNAARGTKVVDGVVRTNTDEDTFYFMPDIDIQRGDRLVYDGKNFDVIEVATRFGASAAHHLEVLARVTDNK